MRDAMATKEEMGEAKALGKILPCHWTPEQRERVIVLMGKPAAFVDEIIAFSRALNGIPEDER
jgi:hypothetical protein